MSFEEKLKELKTAHQVEVDEVVASLHKTINCRNDEIAAKNARIKKLERVIREGIDGTVTDLAKRNARIEELKTAVDEKENAISSWQKTYDEMSKQKNARIEELEKQVVDRDAAINLWRETLDKAYKEKNKIIDELNQKLAGREQGEGGVCNRSLIMGIENTTDDLDRRVRALEDQETPIYVDYSVAQELKKRIAALESAVKAEKTVVISDDVVRPTFSLDDEGDVFCYECGGKVEPTPFLKHICDACKESPDEYPPRVNR